MIDWKPYLKSICQEYDCWWGSYTITDVVGKKYDKQMAKLLLFDLQALTVQSESIKPERELLPEARGTREEKEILNVLEGLRKYALEHVLLVGCPGSGKSTALVRLLLEEAEGFGDKGDTGKRGEERDEKNVMARIAERNEAIARNFGNGKIPVLVELRYYETSILDLIVAFLHRHHPSLNIDTETIKTLLRQGQFFLLIDGVNELPSQEAQRNLQKFRYDYQQTTPMVFTTRDLGVGGDLGIIKKLEMQPLTEIQMEEFVRGYLPETGEYMLQHLGERLREFGKTPLLLMMLCSVFASNGNQIPLNLGSVFRRFTEIYDRQLKQDIPVTDESRRWWKQLLRHLAWTMMGGNPINIQAIPPTEFLVAVPRQQVEEIFTEYLEGKVNCAADCAIKWLDDLLKHHLIQISAENKIEFRHQLIQEYYAAERFLQEMVKLSDDELQWSYLNYLKWTEPAALMMGLVDDEGLALRVVRLALQVDWQLGARLAGAVKLEWQKETVGLICNLDLPELLKIKLLAITKSDATIPFIKKCIENPNNLICSLAIDTLGKLASNLAKTLLIKLLKHTNSHVRYSSVSSLGKIGDDTSINELITAFNDEIWKVNYSILLVLEFIASDLSVKGLIKALEHQDFNIRISAVGALAKIGSDLALKALFGSLCAEDNTVRFYASKELSKLGHKNAISLFKRYRLLELTYGNQDLREQAAIHLGEIGDCIAIPELMKILDNGYENDRWKAIIALNNIKSDTAVNALLSVLKDEEFEIRMKAAEFLKEINIDANVSDLIQLLDNNDWCLRWKAINSLQRYKNQKVTNQLIKALTDEDFTIRWKAAETLGKFVSQEAVYQLTKLLTDEYPDVRWKAAEALGYIGSTIAIPELINALEDEFYPVRLQAIIALRKISPQNAIYAFIQALQDEDSYVRWNAVYALGGLGCDTFIPELINALEDEDFDVSFLAAEYLQEVASERLISQLVNRLKDKYYLAKNNGITLYNTILALELIQQKLNYYKPKPALSMSNILSHNYALLIGVGECEEPKLSLPVTVKDIQSIKTLLTDQDLCGYIDNDQHLRLFSNATATSENILDGLNWLKQQAENDPEATIFIYYSGHGCLDESGDYYLIPYETDRVDIPNTALPATKFNAVLQQIPAKQLLVIIDSCHAQGMASSKEGAKRPSLPKSFTQTALPKNIIDEIKQGTGRVVFTSSTGNQSSWVRPDGKMSVYTYHLLEALQGAANQPGDKVVRVSHLMNYLSKTVPETARNLCKAEQTPFFDFATEDFPVALLCGGKGLKTAGWDKQEAEQRIRGITNQVNNGVGNVGDRNIGINIGTAGDVTFGNLSSGS